MSGPQVDALHIGFLSGKPTWIGKYQLQTDGMWFNARSGYGVITYESQAAALAGAQVCQQADLKWNAEQKAANDNQLQNAGD